jgi:hypothetical protein
MCRSQIDSLEPRQLLAWGTYPTLIHQDLAVQDFPTVDGRGQLIVIIDSGVNPAPPPHATGRLHCALQWAWAKPSR